MEGRVVLPESDTPCAAGCGRHMNGYVNGQPCCFDMTCLLALGFDEED